MGEDYLASGGIVGPVEELEDDQAIELTRQHQGNHLARFMPTSESSII